MVGLAACGRGTKFYLAAATTGENNGASTISCINNSAAAIACNSI